MEPNSNILLRSLKPRNLLSFGPEFSGVELSSLNLLIGANGSGKSNLIEAIQVLRSSPRSIETVFQQGGGFSEWLWKGAAMRKNVRADLSIECALNCWTVRSLFAPVDDPDPILRHSIMLGEVSNFPYVINETISEITAPSNEPMEFISRSGFGSCKVLAVADNGERSMVELEDDNTRLSVLAELKDAKRYPEITAIAKKYQQIRIYREWTFGRNAVFRKPQRADMRKDVLEENFSNLGLVLNRLKTKFPAAKKAILDGLKDLYDGISDFDVLIEGGSVQVFFTEGDFVIPATRLSDGTLRYLCLLAILCDPDPPPLICIEEPELGLHPDVLPNLAELLIAASERTQLIVTTYSDILVDAMTERPESVVICEKHNGCTEMKRLSKADLAVWLDTYRLGQLWIDGQIGGKRW